MNTWPSIHREGALALSPSDIAKGTKELDALIASAARSLRKCDIVFFLGYAIWTAILIASGFAALFSLGLRHPIAMMGNASAAVATLSMAMLLAIRWAWGAIQHGSIGQRFGRLGSVSIPPGLQDLIDSFATEVRDARTASGTTVLPELFTSRWAVLLFSRSNVQRSRVRTRSGMKQKEEIFARPAEPALARVSDPSADHSFVSDIDRAIASEPRQAGTDPVSSGTVASAQTDPAEQPRNAALAAPLEISSTAPPLPTSVKITDKADVTGSDSGTRSREDNIKLVAAALDKANISKRDVKSHHIAERWNKDDGRQPDVGAVRSLMKGQQAGAPSRGKADRPADSN